MNHLKQLYRHSLSLLTDLYQLTMAYGYWKSGKINQEAVFTLFFRTAPFRGRFAIATGLETALEYLAELQFTKTDLEYLSTLTGNDGQCLFEKAFLDYLETLRFTGDIDAVPEGTVVFPHEPLLRVQGSLLQCQLLETALLNIINFQTLITTKAVRVCQATQGEPVLEFGLRRAQGIDGSLAASRAAYIGGVAATSNVLAGKLYGIPVKGTHAHSWVMSFASEAEAFQEYANAMPNNCIFLVDTYHTLQGVQQAIQVGHWLRERGHSLIGIRLDSGDLATLSRQARTLLDDAGFTQTQIVASNDLDEYLITELKAAGATISIWGVGTKLITSYDQPALGGVYKLTAIRSPGQEWRYCLKLSEQPAKISNPGVLQIRRFSDPQGIFKQDMLYNQPHQPSQAPVIVDLNSQQNSTRSPDEPYQDLLVPYWRNGQLVSELPSLQQLRQRVHEQLSHCPAEIKRFTHPERYPVGLEQGLYELKQQLISQIHSNL
ncbi:MAG: nicotinate phosphoribosyltransferase [Beggiatoa sp. IS2]|nr:MAG: nicotinate phosphoribosyltransferase [Beggiatoa sp. IS2]